jgi:hypothetical protein
VIAANILATIGNTPHIRINRLFGALSHVWIKSERDNPGGSIKDRIALSMVEDTEATGKLRAGGTIIEPTSGMAHSAGRRSAVKSPAMIQDKKTVKRITIQTNHGPCAPARADCIAAPKLARHQPLRADASPEESPQERNFHQTFVGIDCD